MISFTVWITNCCNMKCSYCYENNKISRDYYKFDNYVEKIIEFISGKVHEEKNGSDVIINFHGGEPLLEYKEIVNFVNQIREILKGYKISFNIVTNGTLLDREKALWMNRNMTSITLSIDGDKEIHDKNRRYINNKGTYEDIIHNVENSELIKEKIRIRMTINTETVHALATSILHIYGLGFRTIIPSIDYEDDGWNGEKLECLENQLKKVKLKFKEHTDVTIGMTNKAELKIKTFCGGGVSKFDILPNGDVYPCSIVAGLEQYRLGNILTGMEINTDELCRIYSTKNEVCVGCNYMKYCMGTQCKYLNKISTGDFSTPSELICKIENIKYRIYKL